MGRKKVDGNHVIYHYLQKVVAAKNDAFSRRVIERLIVDLSIWLPPSLYNSLPILLPFCVREPSCRSSGPDGADEWGSADDSGYLRDDNSLLKAIAPSLPIHSPSFETYRGGVPAKGFVASHVWREVRIGRTKTLASRHPRLYSFVPNVAWLPVQLSKLTDREGSYAQRILQELSHRIYTPHRMRNLAAIEELWTALPAPGLDVSVNPSELNYFVVGDSWLQRRKRAMAGEITAILAVLGEDEPGLKKVKCSRYLPSLRAVAHSSGSDLGPWLREYVTIAGLESAV